jgi:hypothetical protein
MYFVLHMSQEIGKKKINILRIKYELILFLDLIIMYRQLLWKKKIVLMK